MSSSIHQTVSSATFLKSIQYHLCVGCHPPKQSGHLSLKQILLENKGHGEMEERRDDAGHRVFWFSLLHRKVSAKEQSVILKLYKCFWFVQLIK